ncbi:hypothetical protein ABZ819_04925 [Streptomyces venezuelae]|uniref:hypothetical protein n=1 Tax=Streptomyces venezuelae TaxID=54571 RepID=UPI0034260A57
MSTTSPTIPKETARHVLWMFDRQGGYRPGSCTEYLMRAIQSADVLHAAKLRQVFPELSAAIDLARYDDNGLAKLQAIATGQAPLGCKCGNTAGPFDLQGRCETCTEAAA